MDVIACAVQFSKEQEECKSQEEGDERQGVAHSVHQLQGGQQGMVIVIHVLFEAVVL